MDAVTGKLWGKSLQLDRVGWDVYLLYGPSSRWREEIEAPDFWMHQLGGVDKGQRFDQSEFESKLKEMLESLGSQRSRGSFEILGAGDQLPGNRSSNFSALVRSER